MNEKKDALIGNRLGRRDFLRGMAGAGVALGLGSLASCVPAAPPASSGATAPAATSAPAESAATAPVNLDFIALTSGGDDEAAGGPLSRDHDQINRLCLDGLPRDDGKPLQLQNAHRCGLQWR